MGVIDGMDNSVFIVFLFIMGFFLYILWNVLKYIMKKTEREMQDPYNINFNAEGNSDPYANSGTHEDCSICTERIKYKIELDCQHSFCGKCIMDYYETLRPNGLKCPLCRREVRLINAENLIRDASTSDFYDKIVRFNYRHLNGWNFVFFSFLLYSIVVISLIFLIYFTEESEISSMTDSYYFISFLDWGL